MASNKLPKNGIIESLIDINTKLQRIQRSICCNSGGTGLTIVTTTDSDSVFFTGDGTPENPLSATTSGGSSTDTIYSADGSIAGNRTVNLGASTLNFASAAGSTFSAILNTADSANTSMVRVRSGGGGGGVQLTTSGGNAGFQAGTTYGFRIQNGNNTNSIVTITGGGQFNVLDQSDIRLRRGEISSGDYSSFSMYPSSGIGPNIQDNKASGVAQLRVEGANTGTGVISRFLNNSSFESNTQVYTTGFLVNRVNTDTTIIPQFKVDTSTQKVVLPLLTNITLLGTDATGNIQDGSANVITRPITGYVLGANTALAATDTILGAFQKVQGQLNAKSNLASPTFTGTPLSTTATPGTNTTQIATTAFVTAAITANPTSFDSFQKGTITTTNATPTTILTFPTVTNTTHTLQLRLVGRASNNIDAVAMNTAALIVNTAGVVTDVGESDLFSPVSTIPLGGTDLNFVVSGTNILIQVTGVAATTINWKALLTVVQV